ncbi:phosphotransferase [Streptomyces goshikiensis]|uniref:phosphotransferase n=1 Tax=Streptomyces goshikiensis TaxID=1942 RepID=UPI0037A0C9EA
MFEPPAPTTADRMQVAQQHAAEAFGLRATGRRVWGYQGRTLSAAAGPHWLRLVCAETGTEGGTLWNGPSASRTLPASVPRPDLFRIRDWTTDRYAYRAELYAFAPDPVVSPRPVLDEDPGLPEAWWKEMSTALQALAEVRPPADREAVREEYLRRVIPEFTGHQVDAVTWTTAHGDLHYGNVTRGPHILDWEGWGRAPYGYDAATLYLYALLVPETAARIRTELAPVLGRPEARTGLLTVAAQILQAQDRTSFYAELASPLRDHLAQL